MVVPTKFASTCATDLTLNGPPAPRRVPVWRVGKVKRVRKHCERKVNLLERDLVAVCEQRLDVPVQLNQLLDEWAEVARRTTAPAELLGRLFVLEGLHLDHKRLPIDALGKCLGAEKLHYFSAGDDVLFEGFRRFCAALDEVVVGDLARDSAVDGARDMLGIISSGYERIGQLTIAAAAPSLTAVSSPPPVDRPAEPIQLQVRHAPSADKTASN